MKTKRFWALALAAMFVFGSAQAKDFRRGECKCKKAKMEQRFLRDKHFQDKEIVVISADRFRDPRFRDVRFMEFKERNPRLREYQFREQRMKNARFDKRHVRKHHHRR